MKGLVLAIVLRGVALTILLNYTYIYMQYDHLGPRWDCASIIQNREVSLIQKSGKYKYLGIPFGNIYGHPYNRGVIISGGRNREVPL